MPCWIRASSEERVSGYELRVTSYELRVAGCELRVAGYELRVAGYELRVTVIVLVIEIAEYGKPCEVGGVEDGYKSPARYALRVAEMVE